MNSLGRVFDEYVNDTSVGFFQSVTETMLLGQHDFLSR